MSRSKEAGILEGGAGAIADIRSLQRHPNTATVDVSLWGAERGLTVVLGFPWQRVGVDMRV